MKSYATKDTVTRRAPKIQKCNSVIVTLNSKFMQTYYWAIREPV